MSFQPAEAEREEWESAVLDFLTVRGPVIFGNWNPASLPALAKHLTGETWTLLLAANLLASPQIGESLAVALRLAPREMEVERQREHATHRGRLRGRPDVRATLRTQVRRSDPTLWVVHEVTKRWQSELNAAVAGFLEFLFRAATRLMRGPEKAWHRSLDGRATAIERLLRVEPLRHVRPDTNWASYRPDPRILSRSRFYREIWQYAHAFRASRSARDTAALRGVVEGGWLASADDEQLYELYAASALIDALYAARAWVRVEVVPPMFEGTLARMSDDQVSAEVLFDRAPESQSKFRWIFDRYQIDRAARRPDIQLRIEATATIRRSLIEVKATAPGSQYGRDSIHKVIGYLADFADLWEDVPDQPVKGVVVFTSGVTPLDALQHRIERDEILLSSHTTLRADLSGIIDAFLADLASSAPSP